MMSEEPSWNPLIYWCNIPPRYSLYRYGITWINRL